MKVKILTDTSYPGKLADAELHFTAEDGPALAGMKLVGFTVWERRSGGYNVTFPSRSYTSHGVKRNFALLRPIADEAGDNLSNLIIQAYRDELEYEAMLPRLVKESPTVDSNSEATPAVTVN